jgi:hypothetical protein
MYEGLREILIKKEGFYEFYNDSEKISNQNILKMLGVCSKLEIPVTNEMKKVFYNIENLGNLNTIAKFVYKKDFLRQLMLVRFDKVISIGIIGYVFEYYKNFYNNFVNLFEKDDFCKALISKFIHNEINVMVQQKNLVITNLYEVIELDRNLYIEFINAILKIYPQLSSPKRSTGDIIVANNYFLEYILYEILFITKN